MQSDLSALIAKLEGATEGCAELSRLVAIQVGWRKTKNGNPHRKHWLWLPPGEREGAWDTECHQDAPAYTTSLDAALTLVPEGLLVENLGEMRDSGDMTGHWLAQLAPRGPRRRMALGPITAEGLRATLDGLDLVSAPTPALALCLAALRARATDTRETDNG